MNTMENEIQYEYALLLLVLNLACLAGWCGYVQWHSRRGKRFQLTAWSKREIAWALGVTIIMLNATLQSADLLFITHQIVWGFYGFIWIYLSGSFSVDQIRPKLRYAQPFVFGVFSAAAGQVLGALLLVSTIFLTSDLKPGERCRAVAPHKPPSKMPLANQDSC